jgi:hypothetical protein|tara:strand:- start:947 stop:1591 length:645 start_codon:yes stop_codon:yes gene_type:complete
MKSNILYTNGCSFSTGNIHPPDDGVPWPVLLRNYYGSKLVNESLEGGSNNRIIRKTIEFVENFEDGYENLFVVIGWTSNQRWEFYDGDKWQQIGAHDTQLDKMFLKYFYDENMSIYNFELQVLLLGSYLKNKKIKFLFFHGFDTYDGFENVNEFTEKEYYYSEKSFKDIIADEPWCSPDGFRDTTLKGDDTHPNNKGHKIWSEILIKYIEENIK